MNVCTIDGCTLAVNARGLCNTHQKRLQKHGDPLAHIPPGSIPDRSVVADERAIAYYTGGADARNGRPPRTTNSSDYMRGYLRRAGGWGDK